MDETLSLGEEAKHPVGNTPENWGPFRLVQKVGQGSFGEVYRAFDTTLEREVALKLLLPQGVDEEDRFKTLLREARAIARVRHQNVVPVYGVDKHDGRVGFWSDFVSGKTLSALLAAQGPFGPVEAAHIGIDLCRAVGAVHAAGLLHRDIKTGNAMREEGGRILLMDFGLTHDRNENQPLSGTPVYMAPEILAGHPATVVSDIYALGIVLFHLLTGAFPVAGSRLSDIRAAHETGTRLALLDLRPDLPEALSRVVETAAHPDPAKRYASTGQMIAALSGAMGFAPGPAGTAEPSRPKRALLRTWMLAPAVLGAALIFAFPQVREALFPAKGAAAAPLLNARQDYRKAHDLLEHYYKPQALATALPLFQSVVEKDPQFAPAWADLGRANFLRFWQLRDNRYVEPARSASLRALALNRELVSAHVTLGMLYTETGQNDLASQELTDAMALDRRNAEVYSALAELYYREGRAKDVEPTFEKSVELAPDNWRLANEFGYYYLRVGKFDLAAAQFQKAVNLTPDNARAHNNLGYSYWRQDRLPEARASLEEAIRLEPGASRYLNLGHVLEDQGKYPEAAAMYQKAVDLDQSSYLAWGLLGSMYARLGTDAAKSHAAYSKAIALAEELRKERKNLPGLLADLGGFYAAVGNDQRGVPLLRRATALAPEDPEVLSQAAVGFEMLHHRDEALKWMRLALEHGYPARLLDRDPAFSALRADRRYRTIIKPVSKATP